jgi:putative transposase
MAPRCHSPRRAKNIHEERARFLAQAYERTPERFVARPPRPPALPTAAWINKPDPDEDAH